MLKSSRLLTVFSGLMVLSSLMACTTMEQVDFVDEKTGVLIDRHWQGTNAANVFAPSTATAYDWNRKEGRVDVVGFVAGATPLQQVVPIGAAAIIADGTVRAARATAPDVVNVNNSNHNSNSSSASSDQTQTSNSFSYAELSAEMQNNFNLCMPVEQGGQSWKKAGCN